MSSAIKHPVLLGKGICTLQYIRLLHLLIVLYSGSSSHVRDLKFGLFYFVVANESLHG